MNETVLNSIIRLFALITLYDRNNDPFLSNGFVKLFLKRNFNENVNIEQIENYESCLERYRSDDATKNDYEDIIISICSRINTKLTKNQRLIILINLLYYLKYNTSFTLYQPITEHESLHVLFNISKVFKFSDEEYFTIKGFLNDQIAEIPNKNQLLIVNQDPDSQFSGIKHLVKANLQGQLIFLHMPDTNTILFRYKGETTLNYNQKTIYTDLTYFMEPSAFISIERNEGIYYNEVMMSFMEIKQSISLVAAEISFKFPNSKNGIEPFSFQANSGELVGIMGISGSGKSTLLNLLNGNLHLNQGGVYINGVSVHSADKKLNGIIGYVPQDDLIIEELTVFENLYFNAKFCFGNLPNSEIVEKVNQELESLDIFDIKDLPTGSPLNKFISGGQRKRLNIALETIRKPSVLFIDEPTSGLSSSDSDKIINLLKQLTFSGKLLFINIHQPSSDIFKKLDKLLVLDKGGYPVYFGNPLDALIYFRQNTQQLKLIEGQCPTCKTAHPDDILELIELKTINEFGQESKSRKYSPNDWYQKFRKEINQPITEKPSVTQFPEISFIPPDTFGQFITYLKRNVLIKLNDKQYIIVSLIVTPVLAFLLSFFVKTYPIEDGIRGAYSFSDNSNIPAFLFMAIIVPLFIGLSISAQEIFKDRKILKREKFLNLSWSTYLNSKVTVLFFISAVQSLSFVLISHWILEIYGMFWSHFAILFSLSCFSNLLGLFLSASVKSILAIYILIPLILIPQLLLSGIIIPFDKINYRISSQRYVPIAADLMPSRWGYEAIMVQQFTGNEYQKHFFALNQQLSNISYCSNYTIPKLLALTNNMKKPGGFGKNEPAQIILNNELSKIQQEFNFNLEPYLALIPKDASQIKELDKVESALKTIKSALNKSFKELNYKRDSLINSIDELNALKKKYDNTKVDEVVCNTASFDRIVLGKTSFIRKFEPIYQIPVSKYGRAHFYSASKRIGSYRFKTIYFNLAAIWIMTLTIYFVLVFQLHIKVFGFRQDIPKVLPLKEDETP